MIYHTRTFYYLLIGLLSLFAIPAAMKGQVLEAGTSNTFVICTNGNLIGSGVNNLGQMCNPEFNPGIVGLQLLIEGDWNRVAAGYNHTLLLHSDGSLWACGSNAQGALGIGELPDQDLPVQVGIDKDWVGIEAAAYVSFGIKSDGTLWGWGTTIEGHFGSSVFNTFDPVQIGLSDKWARISSNYTHVLALQKDSTLWGWGQNDAGQLGTGDVLPLWDQTKLTGGKRWIDVAAGGNQSLGLDEFGKLWATGSNMSGATGLGPDIISSLLWTPVEPDKSWKAIAAGATFSAAIMTDGSLWTFGSNQYGELGLGSTEKMTVPTRLGSDTDWVSVSAGGTHMIAMKENGNIYSWGNNSFSQLGRVSCDGCTYCTEPLVLDLHCDGITGINSKSLQEHIYFYPNPSQGMIYFTGMENIKEVKIFDQIGKLLISKSGIYDEMNLTGLEAGIYIIKISGDSYAKSNLLILQ